ncbi:MAG TPA: Fe2+-dependent dioxygenase [Steroidobacteraceae bacterium]|jgi:PKHD-type hydroxylase|nr:Fe2+-dependent dioxygenase [Steroidobacteraceae bacterium]
MFLHIENLLTPAEVQSLAEIARQGKFIDGRLSNPHNITKDNAIGDHNDPLVRQAGQIGLTALQRSEEARNFVFPKRVAVPTLCRYAVGMKYGTHIDAAFLPMGAEPLRSDVACTMFVARPTDYQGGELLVHLGTETVQIKGNAGSAVFYASTTLHQVVPVTAGERVVMITFIESRIPDCMQRELLYTLGEVRALEGLKMDWRNRTQLEFVIANLLRMWSR